MSQSGLRRVCIVLALASGLWLTVHESWADSLLRFTHLVVDTQGPNWETDKGMHIKAVRDLNGDGYTDLLVAASLPGEPMIWYEGPNWGKHTISTLGGWSTDGQTADLDGDGDADVVISSWYRTDQGIEWYENLGQGQSWTQHFIGPPVAHDAQLADLDLDGRKDIVTRHQGDLGNRIELWKQKTPTSWAHRTLSDGVPTGEGMHPADIDRDGDPDVIIGGIWYENTGDILNGPWTPHRYTSAWTYPHVMVAVADINADGRADIVLVPSEPAGGQYHASWFEAPADPLASEWVEHVIEPATETTLHSLLVVDIDNDGDLDVITATMHQSTGPHEVRAYINVGSAAHGASWSKQVIEATSSHRMCAADLDRDGDQDLFGADWTGTRVVDLWRNELALTSEPPVTPPSEKPPPEFPAPQQQTPSPNQQSTPVPPPVNRLCGAASATVLLVALVFVVLWRFRLSHPKPRFS